jgi:glycosyltransferase involved in cell wall biosynthesis
MRGSADGLPYDVSIVLALHREGKYLRRTLLSLREAANYAQASGISCELVAVLDRSDDATVAVFNGFDLDAFGGVQIVETDNGSLGLTRNAGCAAAAGRYICLADGDDLVSYNFIAANLSEAEQCGERTIFIPQYLVLFDKTYQLVRYFSLDDVTPLALIDRHPFVSRIFFHRELFEKQQFVDVRLSKGFAFEDWHFNAEAVARGYDIRPAKDAILFYRQRSGSLLEQANALSTRQIPPSRLFEPPIYRRVCARALAQRESEGGTKRADHGLNLHGVTNDPVFRDLFAAANRIEPLIELDRFAPRDCSTNLPDPDLAAGSAYFELCEAIGDRRFSDVFLVPWFSTGGAERYLASIIRALGQQESGASILVLMGERGAQDSADHHLPASVVAVDLANRWPHLSGDLIDLLTLKIVLATAPNARLFMRQCVYAERFFNRYQWALTGCRRIFFRFSEARRYDRDVELLQPGGHSFVSDNLDHLDVIVCDNESIIESDRHRFGISPEKWHWLPSLHLPRTTDAAVAARACGKSKRVLWASRLAGEKRPELLVRIARYLYSRDPAVVVHAYGAISYAGYDTRILQGQPNLIYHGPFTEFERIASGDFACFIYTTMFDGVPNVVLEAVSMGLPVIAPDLGGLPEIISDGETGLLLPSSGNDDEMAEYYGKAVLRLVNEPELGTRLARAALERLRDRHSLDQFSRQLSGILESVRIVGDNRPRAMGTLSVAD